jgi:hypothetical protein
MEKEYVYCEVGIELLNTPLLMYTSGFKDKEKRIRIRI